MFIPQRSEIGSFLFSDKFVNISIILLFIDRSATQTHK